MYAMPAANAVTPIATANEPTRTDDHDDVDVVGCCVLFPRCMMSPGFLAPRNLVIGVTSLGIREAIFTTFS